jgi:hypothetical protein
MEAFFMTLPTFSEIQRSFAKLIDGPILHKEKFSDFPKLDREDAERICQISDPQNLSQTEEEYFECAQKLRGLGDYPRARSILGSLARNSNPEMRVKAKSVLYESIGMNGSYRNIKDYPTSSGKVRLREWSDENDAGVVRDLAILQGLQVLTLLGPIVSLVLTDELSASVVDWESPMMYDHSFDHLPDGYRAARLQELSNPFEEAELQDLSEIIEEGQLDAFNAQLSLKEFEKMPFEARRLFLTLQLIGILSESRWDEWKTFYPLALHSGVVNEKNEMTPGPYRDFAVEQWEKIYPGELPPLSFEP